MASRSASIANQDVDLRRRADLVVDQIKEQETWLEKKLKPKKIAARYPFTGTALLYATCGFGSLGDALFGYNSGNFASYFG